MTRKALVIYSTLLATSCNSIQQQPPDPTVVKRIETICMSSGFFKFINGGLALAYPPAEIPAELLNKGIDKVCTNPTRFASDISTVEWLIKNMPRHPRYNFMLTVEQ